MSATIATEKTALYTRRQGNQDDDDVVAEAKRLLRSRLFRQRIHGSSDVADFLQISYADQRNEAAGIIGLTIRNDVIALREFAEGSPTEASISIRNIVFEALKMNAVTVILFHNHPSGYVSPSKADFDITQKVKEGLHTCEIRLLDHIIVGLEGYFSFADEGHL